MKDQNYQFSQEASERFEAIKNQMGGNNAQEEENDNNIRYMILVEMEMQVHQIILELIKKQ